MFFSKIMRKKSNAETEGPITLLGLVNRISGISRISGRTSGIPGISRTLGIQC